MTTLQFADTHNFIAFLAKPTKSEGFEQVVDFLNASSIKYALTVNPTIYTSFIEQFSSTIKAKMVNGEVHLQALVDGKKIVVTEATVRRDLQLEDADVLDLENTKTAQAQEITSLKKRLKRSRRVVSSQEESLGDQEDASKQGRIDHIDADKDIYLVNVDKDEDMFRVNDLEGDEVVVESEVADKDVNLSVDEVTLAQALAALKSAKVQEKGNVIKEPSVPVSAASTKVSTVIPSTAATTLTAVGSRHKAKGIVLHEQDSKRAGEALEQESSKKQKMDDDKETEELKQCMEIILDDGDDMLKNFDREDLEVFWSIVKARFKKTEPVNYMDIFLHLNLKTIFEHQLEDSVWKNQQGIVKVLNWKLCDSCGVHSVTMQNILYYLLVEKMYPLTKHTLHQMFNDVKLQVDYECEMAFKLLRLVKK
ncbi:hypothetical protein Tco_0516259 [Tanacetum coccineum]